MKNNTTPRNFADCTWVQTYGRPEPLWERVAGYALALAIGCGMAALLVAWWSS
jgi:ferric-dicitrate binding protein FerR (iron transport regulator)